MLVSMLIIVKRNWNRIKTVEGVEGNEKKVTGLYLRMIPKGGQGLFLEKQKHSLILNLDATTNPDTHW